MDSLLYFLGVILCIGEWQLRQVFLVAPRLEAERPLSPFLFIIVMEVLSKIISLLMNGGLLTGSMAGPRSGGAINISHILFADDTLIFSKANAYHLCNLRCLFLCYEAV
jgi:hypothetical protein